MIVDVFSDHPLAGDQLAVFPDADRVPEELYQLFGRELNFSGTVFVLPPQTGGDARIRIFSPVTELALVGTPHIATALIFARDKDLAEVAVEGRAGTIAVRLEPRGRDVWFGWIQQPFPSIRRCDFEADLLSALGVSRSELPLEVYDNGARHVFVCLRTVDEVATLAPDLGLLGLLPVDWISCFAGEGSRWKTRVFAPSIGIGEDPATSSAAGALVVHLERHGRISLGDLIEISQGAEIGRPSRFFARAEGSNGRVESIEVGGTAFVVAEGTFHLPSLKGLEPLAAGELQAPLAPHGMAVTRALQRSRARLVMAREEERRRLRRDLHDGLGPALTAIALKIDMARNLVGDNVSAADELLAELRAQVKAAIQDIRGLVYGLRPPSLDELGLLEALREQAERLMGASADSEHPLKISVHAPDKLPPLPAAIEVAAYRIALEAMTNATRHSGAKTCRVHVEVKDGLHLEVVDDGTWRPDSRPGVGLTSMRERAWEVGGSCVIGPAPGGGGRVLARLPIEEP